MAHSKNKVTFAVSFTGEYLDVGKQIRKDLSKLKREKGIGKTSPVSDKVREWIIAGWKAWKALPSDLQEEKKIQGSEENDVLDVYSKEYREEHAPEDKLIPPDISDRPYGTIVYLDPLEGWIVHCANPSKTARQWLPRNRRIPLRVCDDCWDRRQFVQNRNGEDFKFKTQCPNLGMKLIDPYECFKCDPARRKACREFKEEQNIPKWQAERRERNPVHTTNQANVRDPMWQEKGPFAH